MKKTDIPTKADWSAIVADILATVSQKPGAVVLALSGDLGAGKTTMVQALAAELGVREVVNSPTFTIQKTYETTHERFTTLLHMDAYRLESAAELGPLRFHEQLADAQTLFCIEWAEQIKDALPENTYWYQLDVTKDGVHSIMSYNPVAAT